jgi:multiple sugar transport system substrate-binding protein
MSEPKKVDRRKLIYAGLGAVALIAIGAAAYVAMNPPVVTQTVTTATTATTTTVVTTVTQPTSTTPTGKKLVWCNEDVTGIRDFASYIKEKMGVTIELVLAEHAATAQRTMLDAMSGLTPSAYDMYQVTGTEHVAYAKLGYAEPLDDLFDEIKPLLTDEMIKYTNTMCTYEGHIYTLPKSWNSWLWYWRTDLFDEKGLPQRPPNNPQELLDWAKILTDPKREIWGFIGDFAEDNLWADFNVFAKGWFGGYNDSVIYDSKTMKYTFNSDAGVKAIEYIKELIDTKVCSPQALQISSTGEKGTMFESGYVAMLFNWSHYYVRSNDPKRSKIIGKWKAGLVPGPEEGKHVNLGWFDGWGVSARSPNKKLAKEVMKKWYEYEFDAYAFTKLGSPPLNKDVVKDYATGNEQIELAIKSAAWTVNGLNTPYDQNCFLIFQKYAHDAILGKKPIRDALTEAVDACNAVLESMGWVPK